MTSKQQLSIMAADLQSRLNECLTGMSALRTMITELPDADPAPEPTPTIQRDIQLLGEPKPTLEVIDNPGPVWFIVKSMRQVGPANVITINVLDETGNPMDGILVRVGVEDTDLIWTLTSGDKGPGRCEIPYDRKRFWVKASLYSDKVRNITTDVDMPENALDMVNGHINIEITYQLVIA